MRYKNIAGRFFALVAKHACDGRTDGQNYDSQDRASIAASRGPSAIAELLVMTFSGMQILSMLVDSYKRC